MPPKPPSQGKGRSADLIADRNEHMMYRYYFYTRIKGFQYLSALTAISEQFYLSVSTIIYQLKINSDRLHEIMKEGATPRDLQKKFPWFNWT